MAQIIQHNLQFFCKKPKYIGARFFQFITKLYGTTQLL